MPLGSTARRIRQGIFERSAHDESLKRRGLGPFRAKTPAGIFQTVDVGSNYAEWIRTQARKNPRRKYTVVEPSFNLKTGLPSIVKIGQQIRQELPNVWVAPSHIEKILDQMKEMGLRTRHFNVDMPYPSGTLGRPFPAAPNHLKTLIREAPHVLLPNGKIFIASESSQLLGDVEAFAKSNGLKTRRRPALENPRSSRLTFYMKKLVADPENPGPIHRLEITLGLKKAVPDKDSRRYWPRN